MPTKSIKALSVVLVSTGVANGFAINYRAVTSTSESIGAPNPTVSSAAVDGVCPQLDSTVTNTTAGEKQYLIRCGIDYFGGDIGAPRYADDFNACIELCDETPTCQAVAFRGEDPAPAPCYLKSEVLDPQPLASIWGAVRVPVASAAPAVSVAPVVSAAPNVTTAPALNTSVPFAFFTNTSTLPVVAESTAVAFSLVNGTNSTLIVPQAIVNIEIPTVTVTIHTTADQTPISTSTPTPTPSSTPTPTPTAIAEDEAEISTTNSSSGGGPIIEVKFSDSTVVIHPQTATELPSGVTLPGHIVARPGFFALRNASTAVSAKVEVISVTGADGTVAPATLTPIAEAVAASPVTEPEFGPPVTRTITVRPSAVTAVTAEEAVTAAEPTLDSAPPRHTVFLHDPLTAINPDDTGATVVITRYIQTATPTEDLLWQDATSTPSRAEGYWTVEQGPTAIPTETGPLVPVIKPVFNHNSLKWDEDAEVTFDDDTVTIPVKPGQEYYILPQDIGDRKILFAGPEGTEPVPMYDDAVEEARQRLSIAVNPPPKNATEEADRRSLAERDDPMLSDYWAYYLRKGDSEVVPEERRNFLGEDGEYQGKPMTHPPALPSSHEVNDWASNTEDSAFHEQGEKIKTSPDGSCGGYKGYSCIGFAAGSCCSQAGWCGKSIDHCGAGCNSQYGYCESFPVSSKPAASIPHKPSASSSFPPKKTSSKHIPGTPIPWSSTSTKSEHLPTPWEYSEESSYAPSETVRQSSHHGVPTKAPHVTPAPEVEESNEFESLIHSLYKTVSSSTWSEDVPEATPGPAEYGHGPQEGDFEEVEYAAEEESWESSGEGYNHASELPKPSSNAPSWSKTTEVVPTPTTPAVEYHPEYEVETSWSESSTTYASSETAPASTTPAFEHYYPEYEAETSSSKESQSSTSCTSSEVGPTSTTSAAEYYPGYGAETSSSKTSKTKEVAPTTTPPVEYDTVYSTTYSTTVVTEYIDEISSTGVATAKPTPEYDENFWSAWLEDATGKHKPIHYQKRAAPSGFLSIVKTSTKSVASATSKIATPTPTPTACGEIDAKTFFRILPHGDEKDYLLCTNPCSGHVPEYRNASEGIPEPVLEKFNNGSINYYRVEGDDVYYAKLANETVITPVLFKSGEFIDKLAGSNDTTVKKIKIKQNKFLDLIQYSAKRIYLGDVEYEIIIPASVDEIESQDTSGWKQVLNALKHLGVNATTPTSTKAPPHGKSKREHFGDVLRDSFEKLLRDIGLDPTDPDNPEASYLPDAYLTEDPGKRSVVPRNEDDNSHSSSEDEIPLSEFPFQIVIDEPPSAYLAPRHEESSSDEERVIDRLEPSWYIRLEAPEITKRSIARRDSDNSISSSDEDETVTNPDLAVVLEPVLEEPLTERAVPEPYWPSILGPDDSLSSTDEDIIAAPDFYIAMEAPIKRSGVRSGDSLDLGDEETFSTTSDWMALENLPPTKRSFFKRETSTSSSSDEKEPEPEIIILTDSGKRSVSERSTPRRSASRTSASKRSLLKHQWVQTDTDTDSSSFDLAVYPPSFSVVPDPGRKRSRIPELGGIEDPEHTYPLPTWPLDESLQKRDVEKPAETPVENPSEKPVEKQLEKRMHGYDLVKYAAKQWLQGMGFAFLGDEEPPWHPKYHLVDPDVDEGMVSLVPRENLVEREAGDNQFLQGLDDALDWLMIPWNILGKRSEPAKESLARRDDKTGIMDVWDAIVNFTSDFVEDYNVYTKRGDKLSPRNWHDFQLFLGEFFSRSAEPEKEDLSKKLSKVPKIHSRDLGKREEGYVEYPGGPPEKTEADLLLEKEIQKILEVWESAGSLVRGGVIFSNARFEVLDGINPLIVTKTTHPRSRATSVGSWTNFKLPVWGPKHPSEDQIRY